MYIVTQYIFITGITHVGKGSLISVECSIAILGDLKRCYGVIAQRFHEQTCHKVNTRGRQASMPNMR